MEWISNPYSFVNATRSPVLKKILCYKKNAMNLARLTPKVHLDPVKHSRQS